MQAVLSKNGIVFLYADGLKILGRNGMNTLKKQLTIRTWQNIGPDKIAKIYLESEKHLHVRGKRIVMKYFHVPRSMGDALIRTKYVKSLQCNLPEGRNIEYTFNGLLKPNQHIIIDHLINEVFTAENVPIGKSACVLNLKAGRGKTYVASGLINRLGKSCLWIMPNTSTEDQTLSVLNSTLETAGGAVARTYSDIAKEARRGVKRSPDQKNIIAEKTLAICAETPIILMVINTAVKKEEKFFDNFGLVLFDEVHSYCGPHESTIFWKCQTQYVFGMSATTNDRIDKFDPIYHRQIGAVIHADELPGYDPDDVEFKGSVLAVRYKGHPDFTRNIISEATGMLFVPDMHQQARNDIYRSICAVEELLRLYFDTTCKRYVLAFAEFREHLEDIAALLANKDLISAICQNAAIGPYSDGAAPGGLDEFVGEIFAPQLEDDPNIGVLKGGIKRDELELAKKARIILATYSYAGTGLSIIRMNAEVYITSRRNGFRQILPRIMRLGSDSTIPRRVVDIIDSSTRMSGQFGSRKKVYREYGFAIEEKRVSYTDFEKYMQFIRRGTQ